MSVAKGISDDHLECRHKACPASRGAFWFSEKPQQAKGKQELERPALSLLGSLGRLVKGPGQGVEGKRGSVMMDMEPRLIPRLQPQNPMGAADQISTLPLPLLPCPQARDSVRKMHNHQY